MARDRVFRSELFSWLHVVVFGGSGLLAVGVSSQATPTDDPEFFDAHVDDAVRSVVRNRRLVPAGWTRCGASAVDDFVDVLFLSGDGSRIEARWRATPSRFLEVH